MSCIVCNGTVTIVLDCGMQPVSSRFVKAEQEREALFPLALGVCETCCLVQLSKKFPQQELIPKYDWIKYQEPEEHVDMLAHIIAGLKGKRVLGISPKEDSTLEKLKRCTTYRLTEADLGCSLGSESVQKALGEKADEIVKKHGTFLTVIARQIFEHTYNPEAFIDALKKLSTHDGTIIIEVPDSTKQLEMLDYGMLWEEHVIYFTPATLKNTLARYGLKTIQFFVYPYPTEPSIIAIVKKGKQEQLLINEKERAVIYGQLFQQRKAEVREYVAEQQKKGKIALFGAGHMACMLLNLFNLKDYTDVIIDDSEHKREMMMPLSHLKIQNSLSDIKTLLLTVNPNTEEKIIAKKSSFQGQVVSLCPGSSRALSLWKEKNKEVFYSAQPFPILSKRDIDVLKEKAQHTERQRSRLCTHPDENAVVHEMFIIHNRNTYVRPHKHLKKTESLHIIEGTATVILFDDNGNITRKVMLGDYNSGYPFYYRMNSSTYHMLVITSETLAFVEAATGPFDKSETVFPSWAPEEKDKEKVEQLMNKIRGAL